MWNVTSPLKIGRALSGNWTKGKQVTFKTSSVKLNLLAYTEVNFMRK
jgi:hypothetical protein